MMASGTILVYHGAARMEIGEFILTEAHQMEEKDYLLAVPYQVKINMICLEGHLCYFTMVIN